MINKVVYIIFVFGIRNVVERILKLPSLTILNANRKNKNLKANAISLDHGCFRLQYLLFVVQHSKIFKLYLKTIAGVLYRKSK